MLHTQGLQIIDEIQAFANGCQAAGFEIADHHEANRKS